MRVDHDTAFAQIVDGVRSGLQDIAVRTGARFTDASLDEKDPGAPPYVFRLDPLAPTAAAVEVMPDSAYSVYIAVGRGGYIEVMTSPKRPDAGVEDTLKLVEAIAAGRIRERVWRRKKTGEWVDSLLHVQEQLDGPWRLVGEIGRPLPVLRRWRYEQEHIEYRSYRS